MFKTQGVVARNMETDPADACVTLLADRHRRECLERLREAPDGTASVDELVEAALRAEAGGEPSRGSERAAPADPVSTADRECRRRLAIRLHHVVLPKLAAHGVVEYDPADDSVEYRPDDRVEAVLDALSEPVGSPPRPGRPD